MKWLLPFLLLAAPCCAEAGPAQRARHSSPQPSSSSRATASAPDLGRFEVVDVRTDPKIDNAARRYFDGDPRLVGRLITVEPSRLSFDLDPPCTQPDRSVVQRMIAATLAANSGRRNHLRAVSPTTAEFGLRDASRGPVATVTYRCEGPTSTTGPTPGGGWSGAVGFPLANGRRALFWNGEALLILQRLDAPPPPRPSFPCARSGTPTERAICADPALAAWDRSVAAALAWQRDGSPDGGETYPPADDLNPVETSQRAWLAERDRCGADRQCLADRMADRTQALMTGQFQASN